MFVILVIIALIISAVVRSTLQKLFDNAKVTKALKADQKAIIASGFSMTADVKRAQALGAGKYIKKPYTMEKFGMAVKEELNR
jgi:DNA-binding NarL/FixJ family response regulator